MFQAERNPVDESRTALFGMRVRDVALPAESVAGLRPGARCSEAVARLAAQPAPCVVVVDAAGRPIGILTAQDVARRVAFRAAPETPVEAVMTAPVMTIPRREYLHVAIAWMRRHGLCQLPVVDRDGRLAGLIRLQDALGAAASGLLRRIDRLGRADSIEGMKQVKAAQVDLAEELFADHLPAVEIQQLLTAINNDLYRRVGEGTVRAMGEEGWGAPPVPAATIVMGSGGRGENYLFPDQDNGFVVSEYPDSEHARIDAWFLELAERICRDLDAVGLPYCNGYCMAVNPLWRKTLPQWLAQIGLWTRKGSTVAVRLADIFFDFRCVWGDSELARELRASMTRLVRGNRSFLRLMYRDRTEQQSALGLFGGFVRERENREYRGQVNLKYTGTLPLVSAVRLLALRESVEETSTLARIAALAEAGVFAERERDDLARAFRDVTDVLLRQQVADWRAGRRVTYYVPVDALPRRRRSELLESLRIVHGLRKRAHLEFAAQLF